MEDKFLVKYGQSSIDKNKACRAYNKLRYNLKLINK